jgi:antitoxin ParD1/3/4/toxin ParE1/3/4
MKRFKLSPQAAEDIRQALGLHRADNLNAAGRFRLRLLEACRKIAQNPHIGHRRQDLTDKPVLFWSEGRHLIIYNPARTPVEIVRVLHGARNVPKMI